MHDSCNDWQMLDKEVRLGRAAQQLLSTAASIYNAQIFAGVRLPENSVLTLVCSNCCFTQLGPRAHPGHMGEPGWVKPR